MELLWWSRADSAGNWKVEQIIAFVNWISQGWKTVEKFGQTSILLSEINMIKALPNSETVVPCSQILNWYQTVKSENRKCILMSCSGHIYLKKGLNESVLLVCSPCFERGFGNISLLSVEILI